MSSLDFELDEVDEVDEILPPALPAPEQHRETPGQRLDRMLRWQADLMHQRARATDADERNRLQRLIEQRQVGIAYQRAVVARLGR